MQEKQIDYIEINKKSWHDRLASHVESEFYDQKGFLSGKSTLNDIELKLLGDVSGKKILHLQCHFGQDTMSLARLGATTIGVDFVKDATDLATQTAKDLNVDASFVCSDIYELKSVVHDTFDIIFTSYGTIGWLPDLDKWANIVSHFLKPGGEFVFVEFHPVVWMYDDDFSKVSYNYFNTGPLVETESGTYADKDADLTFNYVGWNHSLGEIMSSIMSNNMSIVHFEEYNYSPYNCFKHTHEFAKGKFCIEHLGENIPMVFSLKAIKK